MEENPIRHDYTRGTYKDGWAILDFDFLDIGKAKMTALGLKTSKAPDSIEELYLLPGEEVVVSMPDGAVLYEISKIAYNNDPYDMYRAELNYIQHLSGVRIVTQTEQRQRARQIEWGRQHPGGGVMI